MTRFDKLKNTTTMAVMPARQSGKSLFSALQLALFDTQKRGKVATRLEVGHGLEKLLKANTTLALAYSVQPSQPDQVLGLPVRVNQFMPQYGYAFMNGAGQVIGVGTIKPDGAQ